MNKKFGFTLIELLGVLILLAVIALITYPIIDKVLSNAKNQAYERQKDSIIEAASLYVTVNGNYSTSTKQLSFQTLIDAGFLKEGEILDPRDSSKEMPGCILYNWSESKNQYIFEYSEECKISYAVGDLLKVQVSDTETQNMYVLEVNGDEIVGILDRNLINYVAWISNEDYKTITGNDMQNDYENNPEQLNQNLYTYGPVTALAALNERTSSWSEVDLVEIPKTEEMLKLTDYYKELEDSGEIANWESKYFTDFSNFMKLNYENLDCIGESECREAIIAANGGKYILPESMIINLYTTGDSSAGLGYWTNSPANYSVTSDFDGAWVVSEFGYLSGTRAYFPDLVGVRPIIYINESNILEKLEAPEYVNP